MKAQNSNDLWKYATLGGLGLVGWYAYYFGKHFADGAGTTKEAALPKPTPTPKPVPVPAPKPSPAPGSGEGNGTWRPSIPAVVPFTDVPWDSDQAAFQTGPEFLGMKNQMQTAWHSVITADTVPAFVAACGAFDAPRSASKLPLSTFVSPATETKLKNYVAWQLAYLAAKAPREQLAALV